MRRPTALEVSEEGWNPPSKRPTNHGENAPRPAKRPRLDGKHPTKLPLRPVPEPSTYSPPGQGNDEREPTAEATEDDLLDLYTFDEHNNEKPVFALTHYAFLDPSRGNKNVTLHRLHKWKSQDSEPIPNLAVCGWALPNGFLIDEEDEGDEQEPTFVRTEEILQGGYDASKLGRNFWIETKHAYYILCRTSKSYLPFWKCFWTDCHITQIVLSEVSKARNITKMQLLEALQSERFGYNEEDLLYSLHELVAVLQELPLHRFSQTIKSSLLKELLGGDRLQSLRPVTSPPRKGPPALITDNSVLAPENTQPTCISSSIYQLAKKYFDASTFLVVAPRPAQRDAPRLRDLATERLAQQRLIWSYIYRAQTCKWQRISWGQPISPRSTFYKSVRCIREKVPSPSNEKSYHSLNVEFSVDDYVMVARGDGGDNGILTMKSFEEFQDATPVPTLSHLFWFGRVRYMNKASGTVHLQWMEHSSQTLLHGFDRSRELFLTKLCDTIPIKSVVGIVKVRYGAPNRLDLAGASLNKDEDEEYYYQYLGDKTLSSVITPPFHLMKQTNGHICPVCKEVEGLENDFQQLGKDGFLLRGMKYHLGDFLLYHAEGPGPGNLGQITGIEPQTNVRPLQVHLTQLGRVCTLRELPGLPATQVFDERELFFTKETTVIGEEDIIRPVFVVHISAFEPSVNQNREKWVRESPYHFYVKLSFRTMKPTSWNQQRGLGPQSFKACKTCLIDKRHQDNKSQKEFQDHFDKSPLRVVDFFGGTGAFSSSLIEGSRCAELNFASDIVPSAFKTMQRNNPNAKVLNQDANNIYRNAARAAQGSAQEPLGHLAPDIHQPPPPLPEPHEHDIFVSGFPCPPQSTLNMYKSTVDPRNSLILLMLSEIELIQPKYVYLENVAGFLLFRIGGYQASRYRVAGGLEQGGLKLVVRALLDMSYQCRFGLLQAGDYGAPQSRIRFFLIAAKTGCTLPELPQPTHAFPAVAGIFRRDLAFQVITTSGCKELVRPIDRRKGCAAHPWVTIQDAIGDLPPFDFVFPLPKPQDRTQADNLHQREMRQRKDNKGIPAVSFSDTNCGLSNAGYPRGANCRFQINARMNKDGNPRQVRDLQHFARPLKPRHVRRLHLVPMEPDADYRRIVIEERQSSLRNPLSWAARHGFKRGAYGRLDAKGWFPTTVANVSVTAKQGRVLVPDQHRSLTVRELARSQGFPDDFVFESTGGNVTTMHRLIGNAVAWPVGVALGRELRKAIFKDWLAEHHADVQA